MAWQRLAGQNIGAILRIHPLRPDETLVLRGEWPAAEPGEFTVVGTLLGENTRLESRPVRVVVR